MTRRRSLTSLGVAVAMVAVAGGAVLGWRLRKSPEEHFRDGLRAIEQGDPAAAESAIKALRDAEGFEPHRHLLRGAYRLRAGDPRGALEEFTYVPATGDLREHAILFKGEALYRQGRFGEAERLLLKLDNDHPDHPDVCRWLAAIYYDQGAMNHAISRLEQLTRLEPDDFAPHRLLGVIHSDYERYPNAIEHYQESLRRSPPESDRGEIVRGMAKAMILDRRYAEALDALKTVPDDADVLAMRADALWNLGGRDEARNLLTRAKDLKGDHPPVLLVEARMASDSDRPADAVAPLSRALEIDPHDAEARYQLAMAYRRLGRIEDFEREIAKKEESQALRESLAQLSLRAIDEPRSVDVRDQLADVCERLGKAELAAMWKKAADDLRKFSVPRQ